MMNTETSDFFTSYAKRIAESAPASTVTNTTQDSGYIQWSNIPVNLFTGARLLLVGGTPFRASKILIYAGNVEWRCAKNGPSITKPMGRGVSAGNGWRYGGANELGVVLYQMINGAETYHSINADSASNAQELMVNNTSDIYLNVNDGTHNAGYGDNSGGFDIFIKMLSS